jgi:hypothetical protein
MGDVILRDSTKVNSKAIPIANEPPRRRERLIDEESFRNGLTYGSVAGSEVM